MPCRARRHRWARSRTARVPGASVRRERPDEPLGALRTLPDLLRFGPTVGNRRRHHSALFPTARLALVGLPSSPIDLVPDFGPMIGDATTRSSPDSYRVPFSTGASGAATRRAEAAPRAPIHKPAHAASRRVVHLLLRAPSECVSRPLPSVREAGRLRLIALRASTSTSASASPTR